MRYFVERQYSQDGDTWLSDIKYPSLPSFPVNQPFFRFTRYVEMLHDRSEPLVLLTGEMTEDGMIWQTVNEPRDRTPLW